MITHIATTSVFVSDQAKAAEFYVEKLGFEKRRDDPMGPNAPHWLEVAPPGAQTVLVLFQPTPEMPGATSHEEAVANIGKFTNFIFNVDDMKATHEELSGRGVEFVDQPSEQPWGWWASIKDQDGNIIGLHQ